MSLRLIAAMACFATLALLAGLTLDGRFRIGVWLLLAAMALRTWARASQKL